MEAPQFSSRPPIPEPGVPPANASFGHSFWVMLPYGLWAWPIIALILLSSEPRRASNWIALAIASAALVAWVEACCFLFRTHIDQDGIRGHDAWGRARALRWDQPISIRPRRLLNLRYLTLRSERGEMIWLPLFLRDMPGFREAIHRHAPPEHPLRAALDLPPSPELQVLEAA